MGRMVYCMRSITEHSTRERGERALCEMMDWDIFDMNNKHWFCSNSIGQGANWRTGVANLLYELVGWEWSVFTIVGTKKRAMTLALKKKLSKYPNNLKRYIYIYICFKYTINCFFCLLVKNIFLIIIFVILWHW